MTPKRRSGIVLAAFVVLVGWVRVERWEPPLSVSVETAEMNVEVRAVLRIKPGTQVADRAPQGWTHLIFRSQPRVAEEHAAEVSAMVHHMTGLLFTAMLARVEGPTPGTARGGFRLAEVAVGTGTKVNGRHTVLSSDTQAELGANLSLFDRPVLAGGEEELSAMQCVARSPTMMLIDAPSFMLDQGMHRQVVVRYAVLVDARTGRLETLVWALAADRKDGAGLLRPVEWLAPDTVQECPLSVKPEEFLLGVPVAKKSFAMMGLPHGRKRIEPGAEIERLLARRPPLREEDAREMERRLWGLVNGP